MANPPTINDDDIALFRNEVKHVKRIKQDTVVHSPIKLHKKQKNVQREQLEKEAASFYFSDHYQPRLNDEGPIFYHREDIDRYEVKKLRRGDYVPDFFLDLHGVTQEQAKEELAALICACQREHVYCACVMHGYGKNILKKQVPMWLAQHPAVLAFHQAPRAFGGDAALLLLIELTDKDTVR